MSTKRRRVRWRGWRLMPQLPHDNVLLLNCAFTLNLNGWTNACSSQKPNLWHGQSCKKTHLLLAVMNFLVMFGLTTFILAHHSTDNIHCLYNDKWQLWVQLKPNIIYPHNHFGVEITGKTSNTLKGSYKDILLNGAFLYNTTYNTTLLSFYPPVHFSARLVIPQMLRVNKFISFTFLIS